jgi:hypothetical protein
LARPANNSLSYYNQDTKDDDNLQYVEAMHGLTGYAIVHKLWKHIYGGPGGYYCEWNNINKMLFCKNNGIELKLLNEVLETCFGDEIGIFDKELAENSKILSSKGIQKRWSKIVKEAGRRSNTVQELHRLCSLDTEQPPDNPQITTPPLILKGTETPQSKVKKSKVNESKEKQSNAPEAPVVVFSDFLKNNFSEAFLPIWQRWKDYKLREFKFKYKGFESESAAFDHLLEISKGDENSAVAIIKQSMAGGWKGFFELKIPITKASLPVSAIASNATDGNGKRGLNFLYERYCENPTQVTFISIDVGDYDLLKRQALINFTEAQTKDIHDRTMEFLIEKNKDQNQTNVTNFMKKFGVIEYFRMCNSADKALIFST